MKQIKFILFNILITYLLIEVVCFIVIKTHYIPAKLPSFKLNEYQSNAYLPAVADINPIWGVWHIPNSSTFCFIGDCFKVAYQANSVGARDKERTMNGDSARTVCLGDSFMEGCGVEVENRMTTILESKTKREYLNFGTSGNFAPTQYYLVYKNLAKKYNHNTVLVGILPDNDFIDDDYESGKEVWYYKLRYKPYFVGDYPNYELKYMQPKLEDSYFTVDKIKEDLSKNSYHIEQILKNFTYWYNIYIYYKISKMATDFNRKAGYSGYYDFTEKQLDVMKYSLLKIREEAQNKKMQIMLFPTVSDLNRYDSEIKKGQANPKLTEALAGFCKENNIQLIDLLPDTYKKYNSNYSQLFNSCDGHWTNEGNNFAAEFYLSKNN